MKKKLAILLTAVCTVSLLAGCGSNNGGNQTGTKDKAETGEGTEAEEESGTASKDIEYNASDYVTLGEYMGLEIALESDYEVTEDEVKSSIENMIASYPVYEDSDKTTVEEGDYVNIDYEGLQDGVAFDGGTAQGYVLGIGSGTFIDGFEDGLIGANVGDTVSLDLTFPENYGNTELAGQAVVFNVTINKIVNKVDMTYDTLTDEYVASNFSASGYETVQTLKDGIKEQLTSSNESSKESDTQTAIQEKLLENCTVDSLPEGLLDARIKEYKEQLEEQLNEYYGMTVEDYLTAIGATQEEFDSQIEEGMRKNLELELILSAIAANENIEVDEDGYQEYLDSVVSSNGFEDEAALLEEYGENYVKIVYLNNKAMDLVKENAVITYGNSAAE